LAEEDMARGLVSGNQLMIQKNKNNNLIVLGDPPQLPMEDLTVFNGDLELEYTLLTFSSQFCVCVYVCVCRVASTRGTEKAGSACCTGEWEE
jgi:hypothetical protein